ncbi:hypothetical protein CEXT_512981 [Caerostris extrusa]|uniref:Uncharacterized protein n=1 Tax=Caerostris extrusa TaxID=172846 RepID=A0AAV4QW83_CAEEX|nr:hypothetical protein CEXT_512981 [Caerostris extrusa]
MNSFVASLFNLTKNFRQLDRLTPIHFQEKYVLFPQSKDSVTKEETFVFITKLASSISDSVASDLQQKNDFATVLQLISDCFCDLAGYQPFKLIQSIASLMRLLLDEESTENWNTFSRTSK